MKDIVLTGLDGMNPLGFMAALGALRALAERHRQEPFPERPRLAWRNDGSWVAIVRGPRDPDDLIDTLQEDIESWKTDPALDLTYEKVEKTGTQQVWDLKAPPEVFSTYLRSILENSGPGARRSVDLVASFATDVVRDGNGNTKPTAFHFTAGKQQFLSIVRDLLYGKGKEKGVGVEDLREALFGPWTYTRQLSNLRWDATASREYALRASAPGGEKATGVPGADWLAFRSLPFFTVAPVGGGLQTTACFGRGKDYSMRWPLWTPWLDERCVATVVALDTSKMPTRERAARGVAIVLNAEIQRGDKGYGSFTPPKLA